MKPISTLLKPLATVDLKTKEPARAHYERSDICVVPAAGVVGEAMVALVLAGVLLEKFGSDSMRELHNNFDMYMTASNARLALKRRSRRPAGPG